MNETVEFGFKEKTLQFYFLNRNKIHTYICSTLGLVVLSISYFTAGPSGSDANAAKQRFANWKEKPSDEKLQKEMNQAVRKIPGLELGLEAEKTQTLLAAGQVNAAEEIALRCIERLKNESPFHAVFATNSLLIEKQQFQKALESSVALKEQLEKVSENGTSLYACNLIRIAFLQAKVGNVPGELSAWEEVKAILEMQESSIGAQFLKTNFKEKAFSLNDFISQRERSLILAH